jgi:hypothetical protein
MPFIIPFLPLIAAGATIGSSVGLQLSNEPGSGKPTPAQITQQSQNAVASATQQRQGQAQDAAQLLPNLQYDTGGGLSPDAYSQLSSTFSGNAGIGNSQQLQQLVQQFLGTGNNSFGGSGGFGSPSPGLT